MPFRLYNVSSIINSLSFCAHVQKKKKRWRKKRKRGREKVRKDRRWREDTPREGGERVTKGENGERKLKSWSTRKTCCTRSLTPKHPSARDSQFSFSPQISCLRIRATDSRLICPLLKCTVRKPSLKRYNKKYFFLQNFKGTERSIFRGLREGFEFFPLFCKYEISNCLHRNVGIYIYIYIYFFATLFLLIISLVKRYHFRSSDNVLSEHR